MNQISESIERIQLKKIFRKAEDYELPVTVNLNNLGFYHWLVERTNTIYFIFQQDDQLIGLNFTVNKHVGDQTRKRQCDLCRRFMMVYDVISIRSMRRARQKNVEYHTTYSYICRELNECRDHVENREYFDRLIHLHDQ